jgi:hypothetical protein
MEFTAQEVESSKLTVFFMWVYKSEDERKRKNIFKLLVKAKEDFRYMWE